MPSYQILSIDELETDCSSTVQKSRPGFVRLRWNLASSLSLQIPTHQALPSPSTWARTTAGTHTDSPLHPVIVRDITHPSLKTEGGGELFTHFDVLNQTHATIVQSQSNHMRQLSHLITHLYHKTLVGIYNHLRGETVKSQPNSVIKDSSITFDKQCFSVYSLQR